jgi:adenylate cyclase
MEDIFAIQDEIAQAIAQAMEIMLTEKEKEEIQKAPTEDVQAYDLYLRGRQYFHQFRKQGFDFARQMFARATVIDPNYAQAYAGVAYCCSFLYMYFESSEANLKEADAASRKALELDPDSAEAHTARGLAVSLSKRADEAIAEFRKATELDPRLAEAYYFHARAMVSAGRPEEAVELFQRAADANPDDYQGLFFKAQTLLGLDRVEEATVAYAEALRVIERHLELYPEDPRALYLGGMALLKTGNSNKALDWTRRALTMDPDDTLVLYNVACNLVVMGETEECLDCLEKAIFAGGGSTKEWMDHDPTLDPLRDHPRFLKIVKQFEEQD